MRLDTERKERLLKIDWLSNCGSQDVLNVTNEYIYIKKTKEIEKILDGVKWGNTCMKLVTCRVDGLVNIQAGNLRSTKEIYDYYYELF